MSEFYVGVTAGSLPPTVPTSFETLDGDATPSSNEMLFTAYDAIENQDNGITTKGGVAAGDPPGGGATNEVSTYLSNRGTGQIQTNDIDGQSLVVFSMTLAEGDGTYLIQGNLAAWNLTEENSAAYTFEGAAKSLSGAATELGFELKNIWEEASMAASDFSFSTLGNSIRVTVTGIAGDEINWNCLVTYRYIGETLPP